LIDPRQVDGTSVITTLVQPPKNEFHIVTNARLPPFTGELSDAVRPPRLGCRDIWAGSSKTAGLLVGGAEPANRQAAVWMSQLRKLSRLVSQLIKLALSTAYGSSHLAV
jgi:hypothetical protein